MACVKPRVIVVPLQKFQMILLLLLFLNTLTGCQAARSSISNEYLSGVAVETLSGNASLSYSNLERKISGNGFLMYQKPDKIRAVIMTPFGSVIQEVYLSGDKVTIIDSGNGLAFSGNRSDLPDRGDISGWRQIYWLVDIDPADFTRQNGDVVRNNRFGQSEKVVFENGLLVSKTTVYGGRVSYADYAAVRGVAFPHEIIYESAAGEKFVIKLEEPEINIPFAADAFTPNLNNLRNLPLSSLK